MKLLNKTSETNAFRKGWYLIYTKPKHEKKVHSRLTEMDIRSFLPLKKRLREWNQRKRFVDEPLFPSYIFIYLNDIRNYYDGMDTEGSLYYVKSGKNIARVSDTIINNIQLLVNEAKDLEVSESRFEVGKQLVITKGPLTGLNCEVIQVEQKRKLLVRIELLQRNILLSVPEDSLMNR